jgi:hypothetical protein
MNRRPGGSPNAFAILKSSDRAGSRWPCSMLSTSSLPENPPASASVSDVSFRCAKSREHPSESYGQPSAGLVLTTASPSHAGLLSWRSGRVPGRRLRHESVRRAPHYVTRSAQGMLGTGDITSSLPRVVGWPPLRPSHTPRKSAGRPPRYQLYPNIDALTSIRNP